MSIAEFLLDQWANAYLKLRLAQANGANEEFADVQFCRGVMGTAYKTLGMIVGKDHAEKLTSELESELHKKLRK